MPALISSTPAFDWKRLAIDLQRVDKGELTQQEITDLDFCQEHYLTYEWASSKQHVAAFSTALGEHLSQGKPQSVFRKENDRWVIVYDGKEVLPQPDRRYKGFGYIQYLLQHPGTPVSPFEVPGGDSRGEASREQINELLGELFGYSVSDMGAAKDGASAMKLLRQLEQRLVEEQGVSTDAERHVEIDD
ncbi:MAG: hypothetical protein O7G29_07300 [Acidobacteria bacterium]|nr:hypothetical protein [Acidobacteriota bacterium]